MAKTTYTAIFPTLSLVKTRTTHRTYQAAYAITFERPVSGSDAVLFGFSGTRQLAERACAADIKRLAGYGPKASEVVAL